MSMAYTIKRYVGFVSLVLVFAFILSTEARAELYPFEAVSWNSGDTANDMAAQLSLEVIDYGTPADAEDPYQVEFKFNNNISPYEVVPGEPGVVTGLAFEDGTLFGIAEVIPYESGPGSLVSFVADPSPPAGTWGLGFDVTHYFLADAVSPSPKEGVNPYEAVGIVFDLQDGKDFDDVIAALNRGFTGESGESLRIGIHVQNLGDGGDYSDAFILTPEPGSLLLGSIGIGMVIARCRKRKTLIES